VNIVPAFNTVLLFALLGMFYWRNRTIDLGKVWEEIHALKLRMGVQEKSAPCEHCRGHHRMASDHECDD
jgi:uncharacterized paraquat-inducible protein A